MNRRKNFQGLRACHAIDVTNMIMKTLESSSEEVTQVQEMTLLLLSEIMFNTAVAVDFDPNERGYHDHKGNKQNDGRTS